MLRIETASIVSDRGVTEEPGVAPAIHYSAVFAASCERDFLEMSTLPQHPRNYTRYGNPVHERVKAVMARLEGTQTALVTGSGMGALTTTLLALLGAGDHVVAQRRHYMSTANLLDGMLKRFGVEVSLVDQTDTAAFVRAIRKNTKLIVLESPANPLLELTDVAGVALVAKSHGILTVADNTFASPLNQQPHALGVDIVVHSATKYLGGHHDLTGGIICTSEVLVERIWRTHVGVGSVLSPMDAWLLLRGIRTFPLRMERINRNALALARCLCEHPGVGEVRYPGLTCHPQFALARTQMRGFGGVLTFRVKAGAHAARRLVAGLRIPQIAGSLGGVNSLAIHVATMWGGTRAQTAGADTIPDDLVRYAVGIEHIDDLRNDLLDALDRSGRSAQSTAQKTPRYEGFFCLWRPARHRSACNHRETSQTRLGPPVRFAALAASSIRPRTRNRSHRSWLRSGS
ncbi:methionine gamma-lyase [Pandoraea faecigallinarum]|uniref:trans-sulfuration enzyme family protein n=1 Tax=Pandoraea faecigallinarum TaxID=656179 RepID=UPI0007E5150A|nr:aminotransferase class I/II-fold pyridoxal phosphate-dependent enzyme [Pandoraea faecigallinarum]AOX47785.1 methionine gamma-lyase [Pandoraea faecigallinarum]